MNNDLISRSATLKEMRLSGRAAYMIVQEAPAVDAGPKWIPVEVDKPKDFVSVLGHMTDAGELPSVRECYVIDGQHFFFPTLGEVHPVDKWMDMPEV